MKRKLQITEGKLLPNIIAFAVPVMLSNILQLLFNAVDVMVIGRFAGKESLAAVSSTGSLTGLTTCLFIGLSIGTNVVVARSIGSNNKEDVRKAVQTSIAVALIGGVVMTVVGIGAARFLLQLMKSPADVIDKSTAYLRAYFSGMIGILMYNFGAAIMRAHGDTKRPLYFLMISGVCNVLMNLVFVLIFNMDTAGVGFASGLAQCISAGLVLYTLIKDDSVVKVDLKHLFIDWPILKDIVKIGLPAGLQSMMFSISNIVIQSTINSFDSIIMAGNGAAQSIESFIYNAMSAFYQTCLTFTSQNLGAKKYDRINKILLCCQICSFVAGFTLGNLCYIFGEKVIPIYNTDPEVIAAGIVRFRYVGRYYFLNGVLDMFVGALRGLGYSTMPMINSVIGICLVRVLWVKTVFPKFGTIAWVYLSYPISWFLTSCAHGIFYFIAKRKLDKKVALESLQEAN